MNPAWGRSASSPLEPATGTSILESIGNTPLGEEMWRQSGERVDALVHAVGTAHSIHGTAAALRRHNPRVRVVAVEPSESAVLSGRPTGAHQIEGIGIGFLPPLWRRRGR